MPKTEKVYKPEFPEQARKIRQILGATDAELGQFFGVTDKTIGHWKVRYPEFAAALKLSRAESTKIVESRLWARATGYSHQTQKVVPSKDGPVVVDYVEHLPPETVACIFWLKNRDPENWRDVWRISGDKDNPIRVEHSLRRDQMAQMIEARFKLIDAPTSDS